MELTLPPDLQALSPEDRLQAIMKGDYLNISEQARAITIVVFSVPDYGVRTLLLKRLWTTWGTVKREPGYMPFPSTPLDIDRIAYLRNVAFVVKGVVQVAKTNGKWAVLRFCEMVIQWEGDPEFAAAIVYLFLLTGLLHGEPITPVRCHA